MTFDLCYCIPQYFCSRLYQIWLKSVHTLFKLDQFFKLDGHKMDRQMDRTSDPIIYVKETIILFYSLALSPIMDSFLLTLCTSSALIPVKPFFGYLWKLKLPVNILFLESFQYPLHAVILNLDLYSPTSSCASPSCQSTSCFLRRASSIPSMRSFWTLTFTPQLPPMLLLANRHLVSWGELPASSPCGHSELWPLLPTSSDASPSCQSTSCFLRRASSIPSMRSFWTLTFTPQLPPMILLLASRHLVSWGELPASLQYGHSDLSASSAETSCSSQ